MAKQKRAKGLGVKARKEPKQARVNGSDGEVELGLDNTKFSGFDMGVQVTQDLSVALLGIQRRCPCSQRLCGRCCRSHGTLDILQVGSNNLVLQAEALC